MAPFPAQLEAGYRSFRRQRFAEERERYAALASEQNPEIMAIGCCDSRVSPQVIFDAGPGELFVMRNIANLVPPFEVAGQYHGTSAAIEFAVQALKVKHIVILGHARCGGIRAFADQSAPLSPGDFIGKWMSLIAPAAERVADRIAASGDLYPLELAAIELSLANLLTFPWLRRRVEQGDLHLHGAYFGVADGVLLIRNPAIGAFEPLAE